MTNTKLSVEIGKSVKSYYELCIPEMTARAAQVIELFAAERKEGG